MTPNVGTAATGCPAGRSPAAAGNSADSGPARFRNHLLELLRLAARNSQGLPFTRSQMLRQKNNLPNMSRVVRNLPVDGLHHGMRLTADGHCAHYVFRLESINRAQDARPTLLPPFHDVGARSRGSQ